MDRTAFPAEARAKFLKHAIGPNQYTPASIRIFGIVGTMLLIAVEWNRVRNLVRHRVDLDRQSELIQRGHDRLVKIRHAARFQFNRSLSPVTFQNSKPMIDK